MENSIFEDVSFDEDSSSPLSWMFRMLEEEKKKDDPRIDYSVLSVGVMTLGLILVVEVLRHKIDHAAQGRPFFQAVLEGVYSELATLGIVEFFLWVLNSYYEDMDKNRYYVFAGVHFALFYTAILNAFQTVVLAVASSRVVERTWIRTEMLELNHYVEIREEFEVVKKQMQQLKRQQGSSWGFVSRIRYPSLRRKYTDLLLQIRFHELRVHFLQAYDLPLKLKVSDYLIRSLQHVHTHLVHVSSFAWLLLTGAINLLYYLVGIASYKVEDTSIVGEAMAWIFYVSMALSLVIAGLVSVKMKSIFRTIMLKKKLWDVHNVEEEEREQLSIQQLALFWFSDPNIIIAAIQFLQFGYAVTLSVLIIYWKEIDNGDIPNWVYFAILGVSYAVFVWVMAEAVPHYTMCTSLGQLVDEKRLHESLAVFKLEEAHQKFKEQAEMESFDEALIAADDDPSSAPNSVGGLKKSVSALSFGTSNTNDESARSTRPGLHPMQSAASIAHLVKMDTASLRSTVSNDDLSISLRSNGSGGRRKSSSAGVADMASMLYDNEDATGSSLATLDESFRRELKREDTQKDVLLARSKQLGGGGGSRRRLKAASDGVATMARMHQQETTVASSGGSSSMLNFPATVPEEGVSSDFVIGESLEEVSPDESTEVVTFATPPTASSSSTSTPLQTIVGGISKSQLEDTSRNLSSSDDEHSDAEDIPEVDLSVAAKSSTAHDAEPRPSLQERLRAYFLSKKFVVVSNVFGTLVAFYLTGQRIEKFLHTQGFASEKYVSFEWHNEITFWALLSMLSAFICVDAVAFSMFAPWNHAKQTFSERKMFLAAILDMALVGSCLIMLVVAEMQRCCLEDEGEPYYTEEKEEVPDYNTEDEYGYGYDSYFMEPAPCSCPKFGTRMYGGLGSIEPYMSLLALRICRHYVAKRIVVFFGRFESTRPTALDHLKEGGAHHHGNGHGQHGGHDDHHGDGKAALAAMWEATVSENPEIVAKYGEFSGEMLKAMLGLPIKSSASRPQKALANDASESGVIETQSLALVVKDSKKQQSFALGKEYMSLSAEAQGLILAGKLGRAVKQTNPIAAKASDPASAPKATARFYLDSSQTSLCAGADIFRAPGARLLRSLRRCDRILLPILDKWTVVDVAITEHDLVYFDASDDDTTKEDSDMGLRQALSATKGGKGLRLCDVAAGRRIVGHLDLTEIETVHVERSLPGMDRPEHAGPETEVSMVEYWKPEKHGNRRNMWKKVQEDRLRIQSVSGVLLYLRFYSDLEHAQRHPEHQQQNEDDTTKFFKNNALQWAQTLIRLRGGPANLKQSLEHFGKSTNKELRDILVLSNDHHYHHHGRYGTARPRIPRRFVSDTTSDDSSQGTRTGLLDI